MPKFTGLCPSLARVSLVSEWWLACQYFIHHQFIQVLPILTFVFFQPSNSTIPRRFLRIRCQCDSCCFCEYYSARTRETKLIKFTLYSCSDLSSDSPSLCLDSRCSMLLVLVAVTRCVTLSVIPFLSTNPALRTVVGRVGYRSGYPIPCLAVLQRREDARQKPSHPWFDIGWQKQLISSCFLKTPCFFAMTTHRLIVPSSSVIIVFDIAERIPRPHTHTKA